MAAAVFTDTTVLELVRANLVDDGGAVFNVIDEDVMNSIILKHIIVEGTHVFNKMTDNIYTIDTTAQYFNHFYAMSCVGEDDLSYQLIASGSIIVTDPAVGGLTDTRDSIDVTACLCDFGLVMADIFRHLAYNFAREIQNSIGDSSMSINDVRNELLHLAAIAQGVRSI